MPVIQKSRDWFWRILNSVLVVLALLGLMGVKALWNYQASLLPARTISVSAEGKTVVLPDIASFSFSVVAEGKDPDEVTADSDATINPAIKYMKDQGVDAKDIKTVSYNLSPKYEYDKEKRTTFISGYVLTQTVSVKIRDFKKIGKILGKLPDFGINQIGSLSFDVENPDKYLKEARAQAFEKAKVKAKEMASQNGASLGRVVTFSESPAGYPIPIYQTFGKGGLLAEAAAPRIEPGSQEVTVNVSVTYEIR